MKFVLLESLSPIVYHFTSHAGTILEEGRLRTSVAVGTEAEVAANKGQFYFLSLTRHKLGHYRKDQCLVLDGNKLNQKYKGGPMDYWGYGFSKEKQKKDVEAEDRLYTNKPFIPLYPYLLEVHVVFDKEKFTKNYYYYKDLKKAYLNCRKNKVPFYMHSTEKGFDIQSKNDIVDPKSLRWKWEDRSEVRFANKKRAWRNKLPSHLKVFYRLLTATPEEIKTLRSRGLVSYSWFNTYYNRENIAQVSNDIHNDKNSQYVRPFIDKIIQAMHKQNLKTIPQAFEAIEKKIRETDEV